MIYNIYLFFLNKHNIRQVIVMNIINKISNYIREDNFQLIYLKNMVNVINYEEIREFTDTLIVIKDKNNLYKITGKNLVVSKMQDNEILITGVINNIELLY